MLRHIQACLRGSLKQTPKAQYSSLRYSSTSSDAPKPIVLEDGQDITDPVVEWLSSEGEIEPLDVESIVNAPVQALPIERKPIYLTMSELLPPDESQTSPSSFAIPLSQYVFGHNMRRDILHACVIHHLDGLRQGTASTKTRAEVRGSNRKIRAQKGSGRARLGDIRSPSIRGGGTAFGPKPRDFATLLPRKVRELGMRIALSSKLKDGQLGAVESLEWQSPKTKDLWTRVKQLGWTDKTLFLTGKETVSTTLDRASGNVQTLMCGKAANVTVYDILKWRRVIMDIEAVEWFERELGPKAPHGLVVPLGMQVDINQPIETVGTTL